MRNVFLSAVISACILMSGCDGGGYKIDASNEETMTKSIEKIRNSLSEEKKAAFDEALQIVIFFEVGNQIGDIFSGKSINDKDVKEKYQKLIDKKSANDILKQAEGIKIKIAEKEKQEALDKIKELEKQLKKISWTEKEAEVNQLRGQLESLEADILAKKKQASELQVKIGMLREVESILEE